MNSPHRLYSSGSVQMSIHIITYCSLKNLFSEPCKNLAPRSKSAKFEPSFKATSYYTEGVFTSSMCVYFRVFAVCITFIAKPTCIYFRFSELSFPLGHLLFFLFCPKLFRISENVRTIFENVRTFHLSEAKLMLSLLVLYEKRFH
jgi:hypothetical protein